MTQAPTPGTKPLRSTHDLGEIVGYSYRVYIRDFVPLFLLAILTLPLALASGAVEQRVSADDAITVRYWFQFPILIVQLIITGAVVWAANQIATGSKPSFSASLDAVFERFTALIGSTLLAGFRAVAALLAVPFLALYWWRRPEATIDGRRDWWFAVVPGALFVFLLIRWVFVTQAVMIEGKRSWAAIDDSSDAVRGSWWRCLGIILVLLLITFAPLLAASPADLLDPLPSAAIFGTIQALTLPFFGIGQTLLYYDLKIRTTVLPVDPVLEPMEGAPE